MRQHTVLLACICSAFAVISAIPLPASNQELDVLQIPLNDGKELDVLTLGTAEQLADRNKRTIGLLRDLFPDITKQSADGASIDLEALNKQLEETIRVARQASEAGGADAEQKLTLTNEVQGSSSSGGKDQQTAESKSSAIDELNLDSNEDGADADDRNKRFLPFGGSSTNGGDASASKGNSGNFLFDIIRLFSGSVQTQTSDEASNSPSSSSQTSEDSDSNDADSSRNETGYTEGIPGPVTRFVVLANRGLANLIQDLILRIAATSERLVNFKARLITALI